MKNNIHPEYFEKASIVCACGTTYTVGSTQAELQVELCAACHPFYTGTQKILDTERRVERFEERAAKQAEAAKNRTNKKEKRAKRNSKKEDDASKAV